MKQKGSAQCQLDASNVKKNNLTNTKEKHKDRRTTVEGSETELAKRVHANITTMKGFAVQRIKKNDATLFYTFSECRIKEIE